MNFPQTPGVHPSHLPEETPVNTKFYDEVRISQKNGIVRQWSIRGERPRQPVRT